MTVLLRRLAWKENDGITPNALNQEVQNIANHWNRHNSGLSAFDFLAVNGASTFNGDVKIKSLSKLYLDGGGDTYLVESSANTILFVAGGTNALTITATLVAVQTGLDFAVQATQKIFPDGGGNTFIQESAADTLDFVTNGSVSVRLTSAQLIDYRIATTALGGGAAATLGTVGGSGPGTAAQNSWIKIKISGTDSWLPVWR